MLRTSLRTSSASSTEARHAFLSSNAQDFIEDAILDAANTIEAAFLSSNAQDFIEDIRATATPAARAYS